MKARVWRWSRIRGILLTAGGLILGWALFRWPRAAAAGVSRGLAVCGQTLIPSLLPLLVLTDLFCRIGPVRPGRRAARITEKLFRLPAPCALPLLLGAVGGYPAGAAALRTLTETGQIDGSTAKKALPFCVNAGPAFLIGTVGAGMLGSVYKGVVLYACHIAASLALGLLRRGDRITASGNNIPPIRKVTLSGGFSASVAAAVETLLGMCGFVLTFAALLSVSDASGLTDALCAVLDYPFTRLESAFRLSPLWPALWEVSVGAAEVVHAPLSGPVTGLFLGAAAGWGGISVHCQIRGIWEEWGGVGTGFPSARACHALLGGGLSWLAFSLLPIPTAPDRAAAVWSTAAGSGIQPVSVSAAAAGAMLALCGSFLWNIARFKA